MQRLQEKKVSGILIVYIQNQGLFFSLFEMGSMYPFYYKPRKPNPKSKMLNKMQNTTCKMQNAKYASASLP
jgi:hypothetical protein|tara:strand:+ start:169 stop:381 length:213 start_codon:yes stop_codon:yes gene_type:complete